MDSLEVGAHLSLLLGGAGGGVCASIVRLLRGVSQSGD